MNLSNQADRILLRHALATVAYRGGKALRGVPPEFAKFGAGGAARTPEQILAHMGDLYDWAAALAQGQKTWRDSQPLEWNEEVARFFASLKKFDDYLASPEPVKAELEKLLQGPVADSLTHIGQITMLRRLAGCPIKGENYAVADIVKGRVGAEQSEPRREF